MPPLSMWLRVETPGRRAWLLWLPLFLLWLLLLPLVALGLACAFVADLALLFAGSEYHSYTLLALGCLGLVARTRGTDVRIHGTGSVVEVAIR